MCRLLLAFYSVTLTSVGWDREGHGDSGEVAEGHHQAEGRS